MRFFTLLLLVTTFGCFQTSLLAQDLTKQSNKIQNYTNVSDNSIASTLSYLVGRLNNMPYDANKINFILAHKPLIDRRFNVHELGVLLNTLTFDSSKVELIFALNGYYTATSAEDIEVLLSYFTLDATKLEVLDLI